jgi:hypothetical protein
MIMMSRREAAIEWMRFKDIVDTFNAAGIPAPDTAVRKMIRYKDLYDSLTDYENHRKASQWKQERRFIPRQRVIRVDTSAVVG